MQGSSIKAGWPFNQLRPDSDNWLHLDALRFVASAGIVYHHSHILFFEPQYRDIVQRQTIALALFVDLFFIVSGFIISAIYTNRMTSKRDYANFLRRRVARLGPLHWLTLAITTAVMLLVLKLNLPIKTIPDLSPACIANNALLLNGLIECGNGIEITEVTWSLSVELALYVLFPLLLLLTRNNKLLMAALTLSWAILIYEFVKNDMILNYVTNFVRGLIPFLMGMAFFKWQGFLAKAKVPSSTFVISLLVTIALMYSGVNQIFVIVGIYLTAMIAISCDLNGNANRLVVSLAPFGQLTYSMYMWHSLFILLFINAIADKYLKLSGLPMMAVAALCYAAIVLWSYWSWLYFETPARRAIDAIRIGKVAGTPDAAKS